MNLKHATEPETHLPLVPRSPQTETLSESATSAVLTEQQVEEMISAFQRETGFRFKKFSGQVVMAGIGGVVGFTVAGVILHLMTQPFWSGGLIVSGGIGFMIALFYYVYRVVPERLRKRGRRKILIDMEASGDVRFIVPLIDAWAGGKNMNYALIYEIVQTLTALLPHLNTENADALPVKQRKLLHRTLSLVPIGVSKMQEKMYGDLFTNCMVEVIRALTRIGDTGALRTLRPLFNVKGKTHWHEQINEVVGQCLLELELRQQEETSAKTLLRASTKEDLTGETLLRSVPEKPETHPETLLRPSEKAENEEERG